EGRAAPPPGPSERVVSFRLLVSFRLAPRRARAGPAGVARRGGGAHRARELFHRLLELGLRHLRREVADAHRSAGAAVAPVPGHQIDAAVAVEGEVESLLAVARGLEIELEAELGAGLAGGDRAVVIGRALRSRHATVAGAKC